MDCVFLGTPDFAVASLKALIKSENYTVKAVFTQPDKKVGRKQILTPPPAKVVAEENGIPVYQPERIRDEQWVAKLKELRPDIMITAAFGQILSKEILDIPPKGTVNVHGSLLPQYRGPAPIQWAVINGEKITGVTTMFTDAGIDTGDMLLKKEVAIGEDETAGELFERLAVEGGELLIETLDKLDGIVPEKQQEDKATYFPMLKKETALIDFDKTPQEIKQLVLGLNPWPVAYFTVGDAKISVYKVKEAKGQKGKPGEILSWDAKKGIVIGCKNGAVELLQIKPAGKGLMDAKAYANGKKLQVGTVL